MSDRPETGPGRRLRSGLPDPGRPGPLAALAGLTGITGILHDRDRDSDHDITEF